MVEDKWHKQLCVRISIGCEACGIRLSDYDDAGNAKFRDVGVIVVITNGNWAIPYCRPCAHKLFSRKRVSAVEIVGAHTEVWNIDTLDVN